jgi:hypothetical protein
MSMQKRVHLFGVEGYWMGPAAVGVGSRAGPGRARRGGIAAGVRDKTGLTSALSAVMLSSEAAD